VHPSLERHRREVWTQILLPILAAALVLVGLSIALSLAALRGSGDVGRWAAISAIWLSVPVMVAELLILAVLVAITYLVAKFAGWIPRYSLRGQRLLHRVETSAKRGADMVRRPMLAFRGLAGSVRDRFERKPERT
jgi:uncharacterized protein involved in cysteine biosynthesis